MLQRLAMDQALLGDPQFLILDEPCAGLDAMGRLEMLKLIEKLKKKGKTILMNSHILNDMEKVCDCGIIMKKGQKMRDFTKADLQGGEAYIETYMQPFAYQNGSGKYYEMGMLKCLILDEIMPEWKENFDITTDLDAVLSEVVTDMQALHEKYDLTPAV